MAENLSSEYAKQLKFPNYPALHCLVWMRGIVATVRYVQRLTTPGLTKKELSLSLQRLRQRFLNGKQSALASEGHQDRVSVVPNRRELIAPALEAQGKHYQTNRWAFVDGMFDEAFHRELMAHWPKRKFLSPPKDLIKGYDTGFNWIRGHTPRPPHLEEHPALNEFFEYLCSASVGKRISEFSGAPPLLCHSFLVITTYPGSSVPPHRDGYSRYSEARHSLNVLFFVDGTGGSHSGGLSIIKDNTFTDVIFEAEKLRNTALIYDVCAPFFHGFRPVERGKFRWAISAFFAPEDYWEKRGI